MLRKNKKHFRFTKKDKIATQKVLGGLLIFSSFIFLWCGLDYYYKGFHSIDLSWNALGTGVFNLTTKDVNSDGVSRTLLAGYINGMNQTNVAMFYLLFAGMIAILGIWQFCEVTG